MDAHLAILGHGSSQVLHSSAVESIACQGSVLGIILL